MKLAELAAFVFALFCCVIESCYVAEAGGELKILLPQPPESWDYKLVPPQAVWRQPLTALGEKGEMASYGSSPSQELLT